MCLPQERALPYRSAHRAANTAIRELNHLISVRHDKLTVNANIAKFIDNNADLNAVIFRK
jgi:hypothetical protein